jgi:pimeloyl-ACP methyl ester carboxylesterase
MKSIDILFGKSLIHYNVYGEGQTILLIHGFGEDGSVWNQIIDALSQSHKCIVPDLPGSGKSEMINEEIVSIEDYADIIKAIVINENEKSLTMIGHSMGGYITLAYQKKYPGDCKAIGLFHSTAFADDENKIATRLKSIEFIRTNGTDAFVKTMIPGLFFDHGKNKEDISRLVTISSRMNPEVLIQYYRAMINRPDNSELLKGLNIPLLLIAGLHDNAVPLKHSLEQSHFAQICSFHILRNSAHKGMIEETDESIRILAKFLHLVGN